VDLSIWSVHENLFLRRSQIRFSFLIRYRSGATALGFTPDPDSDRLDLISRLTIDDQSTSEIDDGLSWELLTDGRQRLWVHIADPTRWLLPEDELDLEARRRGTTVYLPTGMISMFPRCWQQDR